MSKVANSKGLNEQMADVEVDTTKLNIADKQWLNNVTEFSKR